MRRLGAAAVALAVLPGAAPLGRLDLGLEGLRSAKGQVRVCVTADPAHFPACERDPAARTLSVPAASAASLTVADLPDGAYAVALFHDENGNGKLDTRFGIPIEGFGFSNNPRILFGPPSFAQARIEVTGRDTPGAIRLRYLF